MTIQVGTIPANAAEQAASVANDLKTQGGILAAKDIEVRLAKELAEAEARKKKGFVLV